ncbi:antiviral reverse transcriptase Drt3a [Vreelandella zhaodongensis]|uniref:RNA-directed DNA polymerase n=1 Tax=Vreelandella zhaodongensis TaxID=1176240 RepID=A0ABX2SWX7_VREZH|nr:antiviral reverse transcriptase Drt3a [Halomonas zhaodongensis]NYS46366.1 RNA-directed DNA polymerase [Halomonas zhaodongensis]
MLKQVFDKEQLSKVLTSSDVWQWDLLSIYGDVEKAVDHTVKYWKLHNLNLSLLEKRIINGKTVFSPAVMEDAFAIKLLDRFVRRIYKVRQSDRNRIVRQLITLLKDSGCYHVLRLDIKDCYESIQSDSIIRKFEEEMILAPECIKLLNDVFTDLRVEKNMHGLPRGLSISPTLAELYLEDLDKKIASHNDVIYCARYVDDIVLLTPVGKEDKVKADIQSFINEMGLSLNDNKDKCYSGLSSSAEFDYLGYSIKVERQNKKPNKVNVRISQSKINRIKTRIVKSFCDYRKRNDLILLKRRLEYLCMLKHVRKGKNGDLLAGIAYNYQYVTDGFECLKEVDGFLCQQLVDPRFGLAKQGQEKIKKVSIYGNARKGNIGKFSKSQTIKIMRVWKNA